MGVVKGALSLGVLVVALLVGVLMGPLKPVALEIVDWFDRQLDTIQEGAGFNSDPVTGVYVTGLFAPVQEEHASGEGVLAEVVSGAIPADLEGIFLRIGPNPWAPLTKRHMVFDGDGMLHTLRFKKGQARYHNAYMETSRLHYEQERGAAYFGRIGELHKVVGVLKAVFVLRLKPFLAGFPDSLALGQANTAVGIVPDGRLWALHEASYPFEIRLSQQGGIASVGLDTMDGKLDFPMSAHPKIDHRTGEVFFHGYSPGGGTDGKTFLAFGRFEAGKLQSSIPLKTTTPGFNHDMALTESYALVFDSPIKFDAMNIATGGAAFKFKEGSALRLAVVPRRATSEAEVKYFDLPAVAFVHSLHAWEEEEGQVLVFWLPLGYSDPDAKGILEGCCERWHMSELRLDLRTSEVSVHAVDPEAEHDGEFTNIRSELVGSSARYGYSALINKTGAHQFDFIGIAKWDMKEKRAAQGIYVPEGHMVGESVLMPRSGGNGDPSDDGYIGTYLYSKTGDGGSTTDFVIYDARTMAQEPVARLRLPLRVPPGFHAQWLSEEQLQRHLAFAAAAK